MLAGRMKLVTFRRLVGAAVIALIAVPTAWFVLSPDEPEVEEAPPAAVAPPDPAPTPPMPVQEVTEPAPPQAVALQGRAAIDAEVLSWAGRDLGTSKRKDVTTGRPYKINVYQDDGFATANRAKLDLDRDDRWDEKFTFADGEISRKVAPADDESYTQAFVWDGTAWQPH